MDGWRMDKKFPFSNVTKKRSKKVKKEKKKKKEQEKDRKKDKLNSL